MNIDILSLLMGKALGSGGGGGGGDEPKLPADYQEVEYLEAAGGAWSHIPFGAITSPCIEVEFSVASDAPSNVEMGLVGNGDISSAANWELYVQNTTARSYGQISLTNTTIVKGQKTAVQGIFNTIYRGTGEAGKIFIGAYSSTKYPFYGKIYSVTNYATRGDKDATGASRWNAIVFKPCKRKSDNVAGWCNLTTGEFYPSDTETPWTAGPDVN